MEIPKLGPSPGDVTSSRPELSGRGPQSAAGAPVPADTSRIKALNLPAALQILIAEVKLALVQAGFALPAAGAAQSLVQPPMQGAAEPAARAVVGLFLGLVPDEATPEPAWTATLERLVQAVSSGSAAALERVIAWRDTPATIASAVQEARSLALAIIQDDGPPAVLARPEWLGLGAALDRVRRRRRRRTLLLTGLDADHLDLPDPQGGRR